MKMLTAILIRYRAILLVIGTTLGLFAVTSPAQAQYACPGDTPTDRLVGMHNPGNGVAPHPICVPRNSQPAAPAPPPRIINTYASIAMHPDVDGLWMEGNFDGPNGAEPKVMALCQQAMGGGCVSVGEWQNSDMAIARDWNGYLTSGWGRNGNEARQSALNACRREQPTPCEIVGTYGSGRQRIQPRLPRDLKLYGAGAWPQDTGDANAPPPRNRAWIATGHRSEAEATNAAVTACQQATGLTCVYWAVAGNGVVQTFASDQRNSALPERTGSRAVAAVNAWCRQQGMRCRPQHAYDSRRSGLFVHNFETGRPE